MENDPSSEGQEAPAPAKKKGGRLWLTVVGALVIASASSAAGATFGPVVKQKLSPGRPAGGAAGGEQAAEKEKPGHIAPLDPLVLDVRDEAGDNHHLKVGIALEVDDEVHEEEWRANVVPRARDATITYLRAVKYEDVSSPAKFEEIRSELQERIAKIVKKPKVRKVYFIDFVVQ